MGFQHKLYGAVHDKVGLLMTLDVDQAVALLVDQRHMVPPAAVVAQLRAESAAGGGDAGGGRVAKGCDMRYCLHRYLDALFSADQTEGGEFHALQVRVSSGGNPTLHCPKRKPYAPLWLYLKRLPDPYRRNSLMQVELYVEYDPERLMHFLQASQSYPLERALELCRRARMVREMVFILGRMGSTRKALSLIMNELHDIEQAIGTPPASKPLGRHHPTRPPPTLSHATVPCAVFFVATANRVRSGAARRGAVGRTHQQQPGQPRARGRSLGADRALHGPARAHPEAAAGDGHPASARPAGADRGSVQDAGEPAARLQRDPACRLRRAIGCALTALVEEKETSRRISSQRKLGACRGSSDATL
jgi:hypothetical protein